MKILHVDTAAGWRGGQNQVFLTARGMAALGHDVMVTCRAGGVLEERARAAGLDVRGVHFGGDLAPAGMLGLAAVMRSYRPDVVQLHDPHAVAAGTGAVPLAPGTALVATRRVDFSLRGRLSRWKYGRCRRVVAVSRAIAAVLERDVPEDRLRVVYEGVPDRPAAPGGQALLRDLGVPPGSPVVGNVAALTDHKDHATLLEAAARVKERLPAARFVIAGEGERRQALEAQARRLGIEGHCHFVGFRDDLDRLLPACDVFCLSSHMEGLGTSLLDAMCFARPIVATSAGGMPEAVQDGVTGRVVPVRDPAALAAALVDVLCDTARGNSFGRAGRQRFERFFTDGIMVERTLDVFEELL